MRDLTANHPMIAKLVATGAAGTISFLAAVGSSVIDEATHISLGGAISVGVFACGLVWYLASRLTTIDNNIKEINRKVDNLPCVTATGCPSPDQKSLLKKTK